MHRDPYAALTVATLVIEALHRVRIYSKARSFVFVDTAGHGY